MQLFSRKPSLESCLHKIYTEAYESSLQSILSESSLEFETSLQQWQTTLKNIRSGAALIDGRVPRSTQEKSLFASINDIEKQCRERIAFLQQQIAGVSTDPYGAAIRIPEPDLGQSLESLNLNTKQTGANGANGAHIPNSSPALTAAKISTGALSSNSTPTTTPPTSQTRLPHISAPRIKVEDMPYDLYKRKPRPSTKSEPILFRKRTTSPTTSTTSVNSSVNSSPRQPSTGSGSSIGADNAMINTNYTTINTPSSTSVATRSHSGGHGRSQSGNISSSSHSSSHSNSKERLADASKNSHSFLSTLRGRKPVTRPRPHPPAVPAPRRSADGLDALRAAKTSTRKSHERSHSDQFRGFEGVYIDEDQLSPSPPEPASPELAPHHDPHHDHEEKRHKPAYSHSTPALGRLPRPQIHVEYEKVSTPSGRSVNRAVVVRNGKRNPPYNPHQSNHVNSSHSSHSPRESPRESPRDSPRMLSPAFSEVSDPSDPESLSPDDEDAWTARKKEVLKNLKGVDPQLAKQILDEIVFHGDDVTWDDIAGLDRAKSSLKEAVVYPFLRPDLFMGLREPVLGMLLFGPPGTGKTMLARAVATESKSTFFSITASSLTSKYMGESEKLVKALFHLAKALAPSIIFIDEIDSILTQRADSGEHEASRRIKNEFLVQWSDLQAAAAGKNNDPNVRRVLVLGATNLPWAIDEAARRRFVRRQYIPLPEAETRKVHLQKLLSHQKHGLSEEDVDVLVKKLDGYSGSDITALAKDAAMGPLRSLGDALLTTSPDQIRSMQLSDFEESMRTIKPSVSQNNLQTFEKWAADFGSSGA